MPGNHEIGNTAKFWRDGKKSDPGFGDQKLFRNSLFYFTSEKSLILLVCVINKRWRKEIKKISENKRIGYK